ncbi:DNA-methyltransferase [Helicobacter pylori]|uniref:DNA-methyltransferase n=1 Tax=Helicobacter pylori TaxID=210 RepID=UPI00073D408F|nr:site-specific DNA-methyltransferase [Helicobacter pylori]OKA01848.1 DNA methyltransferase [Helicobacter pylori]OKA02811.1 DNA methyltransferase [Helicobacter pylori]OMQ18566.1 DNA methyltransferase [Helicobacter pylori]OMQ19698.1 DNA methyltransferase [Helicobacter pylori]
MIQIHHANAFEIIKDFYQQNLKVDAIITDPPYNISVKNHFSTLKSARRQGIDFGEWDKNFKLLEWIKRYAPLVNPNGCMIIFCSYRFISHIADFLEENGFVVKDFIQWVKSNPMPRNLNRRYVQDTEFALWAVKKKAKWVFNKPENEKYLRPLILKSPVVSGLERVKHPTQKSLALMEKIISIHTNPNDIVLDPFMGSGTTGLACKNLKRNFIGIELEKEYFQTAKKRLNLL